MLISPINQGSYSPTTYYPIIFPINHILPKKEKKRNKYKIIWNLPAILILNDNTNNNNNDDDE